MHASINTLWRKNQTAVLKAMAATSQQRVAELVGVSEGTISVFKNEQLERAMQVISACGLKVVDKSCNALTHEELNGLKVWAFKGMQETTAPDWEVV
jgi:DNA-binding XRE family transcriptional regulator